MNILITGAKGQLGNDLIEELNKRNINTIALDIEEMDITNEDIVNKVLNSYIKAGIDSIIHCAAYTAVDKAEDEKELAYKINTLGTKYIARFCSEKDIPLMYISTDYIFNGEGTKPWEINDKKEPLNVYGQTKYEGELFVEKLKRFFIIRISWVFGLHGNNFIKTMLKLAQQKDELNVVDDQVGSPTYTKDLSVLLSDMILSDKYGIYHASNEGFCSWYEFAKEIFKQENINIKVNPVDSNSFITKAKRPHNSRMDKSELINNGFNLLPSWKDALKRYLDELNGRK